MDATPEVNATTEACTTAEETKESIVLDDKSGENQTTDTENVDYCALAVTKLTEELINFKGGQMEDLIHKEVAETLIKFSKQSVAFAEVVTKTPRTLSDCCAKIIQGAERTGISDIKAYRAAVQFYFPNSDVMFHMQIRHTGAAPSEEEINRPAEKPQPPANQTSKSNNTSRRTSTVNNDTNTDTNTIHLDLFADDEEATPDEK